MSLQHQQSLVEKIKLSIMVSIETIIKKQTYQKNPFPGKRPVCKHQQIDYFLLINNVPDFEKRPFPFVNNNNNNLFLRCTLFLN